MKDFSSDLTTEYNSLTHYFV